MSALLVVVKRPRKSDDSEVSLKRRVWFRILVPIISLLVWKGQYEQVWERFEHIGLTPREFAPSKTPC